MRTKGRSGRGLIIPLGLLCTLLFGVSVSANDDGGNKVTVEEITQQESGDVMYITPETHPDVFFAEHFDSNESFERKWMKSTAKKDGTDAAIAKYDGVWAVEEAVKDPLAGDYGLVLKSKAKHSAISSRLRKPFKFTEDKVLIVQYELNFQNGQDCGGGYLKLLSQSKDLDLKNFGDKTPYTIMFGPDKCGSDSKLHFIIRHENPKNGTIAEKHCKKLDTKERTQFEEILKDKRPHLYRLLVRPDNSYEISIDYKVVNHGNLLTDFDPPINPPAEIDDPNDSKPADWDEREKIADPEASKPEDWDETQPKQVLDTTATKPEGWLDDEPDMIPDPSAEKPDDWDEDMDGEWEAPLIENPACTSAPGCGPWAQPMIDNPLYKGKWKAPMINNPNYKGKWKPRKIDNPDYYNDAEPFKRLTAIGAIGIELWSMSDDIYFDNLLITDSPAIADSWAAETYDLKIQKLEANDAGLFRRILLYSNRNPWLYAVYVVVVGLPLVLIVTFCCSSTGDPLARAAAAKKAAGAANGKGALNDPKKTDDIQEDDQVEEEEEEEGEEEGEEENEDDQVPLVERRTSPRKRRARKE